MTTFMMKLHSQKVFTGEVLIMKFGNFSYRQWCHLTGNSHMRVTWIYVRFERWLWQQGVEWLESEARRRRLLWELRCKMMKDRSKAEKVGREKDQSWTAFPLQFCLPKSNKFYSSVKSQFLPATPGSLPWFPGQMWVRLLCALTIPVLFTV